MAIFGSILFFSTYAFAYSPISTPAFLLSVANSASAASCGSGGVSSAITVTPAARAFSIAGTIAFVTAGVIRMPLAPCVVMFSSAVTWLWLSRSVLPDALTSSALFASAAFCAASFIFTKNGLLSVLVIRPTVTFSPLSPPPLEDEPPPLSSSSPHAATPSASAAAALIASSHAPRPRGLVRAPLIWSLSSFSPRPPGERNRWWIGQDRTSDPAAMSPLQGHPQGRR